MCPPPCPCRVARWGVALLTWCVYSALFAPVFFNASFATVFARAMHGDIPIRWTSVAIIGLGCLIGGLRQIRRNGGHELRPGSVLWSVLVVAAVTYWLLRDAFPVDADFYLVRMFMIGWAVSNAFNLWLQFHFRPAAIRARDQSRTERHARRRANNAAAATMHHAARLPPRVAPDVIGPRGSVPEVAYVTRAASSVPAWTPDAVRDRRR